MALRMFREGDWVNLVKNGRDYLDKPHLLFWSAMAGYHALRRPRLELPAPLGAGEPARRVLRRPAGAAAVRPARRADGGVALHHRPGHLLGNHDVRMDALLTGFTAFALWQLVRWAETEDLRSLLLGGAGWGWPSPPRGWWRWRSPASAWSSSCGGGGGCSLPASRRASWWRRPPSRWRWRRCWSATTSSSTSTRRRWSAAGPASPASGSSCSARAPTGSPAVTAPPRPTTTSSSSTRSSGPSCPGRRCSWRLVGAAPRPVDGQAPAFHAAEQLSFLGPLLYVAAPQPLAVQAAPLPERGLPAAGGAHGRPPRRPGARRAGAGSCGVAHPAPGRRGGAAAAPGHRRPERLGLPGPLGLGGRRRAGLPGRPVRRPSGCATRSSGSGSRRRWPSCSSTSCSTPASTRSSRRYQPGSAFARQALRLPVDWDRFYFVGGELYQPFQFYTGHLVPSVEPERIAREVADGTARLRPGRATVGWRRSAAAGLRTEELASSPSCRITMIRWPLLDPGHPRDRLPAGAAGAGRRLSGLLRAPGRRAARSRPRAAAPAPRPGPAATAPGPRPPPGRRR